MKYRYTLITLIYAFSVEMLNAQTIGSTNRIYADSETHGAWGLGIGSISEAENAIDSSSKTASKLTIGLALLAGGYQQTLFFSNVVPENTLIHIKIGTIATGVSVAGYTIVSAYDASDNQLSSTGKLSVVGLLGGENTYEYIISNATAIKSITISLGSTVGIGIVANIYGVYYESPTIKSLTLNPFDVLSGTETSSILNIGSALSAVLTPYNSIDGNTSSAATLYATANVAAQQQLTVLFEGLYPAGTFAHILVGTPSSLLKLSILNDPIMIQLLRDGVVVQNTTASNWSLIDLQLLSDDTTKGWLTIPANVAFNQVKLISNSNLIGVLQSFNIYEITRDYSASVLPIIYTKELNAVRSDDNVCLSWTTGMEVNNKYFAVMRSRNAYNWEQIGTVASNSISGNSCQYRYIDKKPYNETNYYKLIQYDVDGGTMTSKIVSIRIQKSELPTIMIYPNPTSNRITIKNGVSGTRYKVVLSSGQLISSGVITTTQETISLSNIKPNIVFISLSSSTGEKIGVFKIVKK